MYKILFKTVLICCFCFNSTSISAQLNEYIQSENNRISRSQQTEKEIQKFIDASFNNYKLSYKIEDGILKHLIEEEEFTQIEFEKALISAKKHELRKLFFNQNPDKKTDYISNKFPEALSQECVNGDFEDGVAGYSFWSDAHPQPGSGSDFFLSCDTPTVATAMNVIAPATNDFNATITTIDSGSAGYQQYDPVLASFSVNVPTLNTNGGNKCVKLNNTFGAGSSDLSTVSRYFQVINEATIDFNFSLIMDNKPLHEQEVQPYFRVRVLDQFNNVVDEICIIANPNNCLFSAINVSDVRRILYTGWICARLNVEAILNQPGTIEFSVSDCQPSRHFGTVYIDNICGTICSTPQLGALSIEPTNINCPDVENNTPFEVCGTYQSPLNATLDTLILNIFQNGDIVGTINAPTQLTASTFCFTVLPSLFGANPTGDFEFQINAIFNVNCSSGTFNYEISDNSANIGPDVTFINCCVSSLIVTSPTDDLNNLAPLAIRLRERSDWIRASNIIAIGDAVLANGVVYHAENFVELNPGFEADFGSQFVAYPEGCTDNYIYRDINQNDAIPQTTIDLETINLVKVVRGFAILPNPSSDSIEIIMKDATFNKVNITTIDGKVVMQLEIENTNKMPINVSRYANGIYIINIITNDGQLISEKLIKN